MKQKTRNRFVIGKITNPYFGVKLGLKVQLLKQFNYNAETWYKVQTNKKNVDLNNFSCRKISASDIIYDSPAIFWEKVK